MRSSGTSSTSSGSQPPEGWQDYTELKDMLKALGDIARLNIVHALADGGEVKVTELAARLAVSQPLVSWHLAILRRHGLVRTRRAGREVFCSLDAQRFRRCQWLLSTVSQPSTEAEPPGAQGPPQQTPQRAEPPATASKEPPAGGDPGAAADAWTPRRSTRSGP